MELTKALEFVRAHRQGVVVTIRRDGKPQLSNILYDVDENGIARISITDDRAKYHNLRRDPWAALHVSRSDFYGYAVVEGTVELAKPAADPHDETVDELVEYYERLSGQHPDWDEYRTAMVTERRLIARLTPTCAYGMI